MDAERLSTSRRGFLKGLALGAGGIALGSSLILPDEVMGQTYEEYMAKAPMEARWNLASGGMIFF
jgi:hypothetical protein